MLYLLTKIEMGVILPLQIVMKIYNGLPTTRNKINPDLTAYVTERALNGLFVNIAEEENKIRTNPAARVTDLLSKVFGAK